MNFFACPGDQDIQSPSPSHLPQRTKPAIELSLRIRAVRRADNHVITFVTLDVFQILDKQTFKRPCSHSRTRRCQTRREIRVLRCHLIERFENLVALSQIEAGNPDRRWLRSFQQVCHDLADLRCFDCVGPIFIDPIGRINRNRCKTNPVAGMPRNRL